MRISIQVTKHKLNLHSLVQPFSLKFIQPIFIKKLQYTQNITHTWLTLLFQVLKLPKMQPYVCQSQQSLLQWPWWSSYSPCQQHQPFSTATLCSTNRQLQLSYWNQSQPITLSSERKDWQVHIQQSLNSMLKSCSYRTYLRTNLMFAQVL